MAISVESLEDSENLRRSQGYTFPILSDAQEDVIRRWDLVHLNGQARRCRHLATSGIPYRPVGEGALVNPTENFVVRARPEEAFAAFDVEVGNSVESCELPR